MTWPVSQDYNEAIQDPPASFGDPELRAGEATTNALGMPMPRSGNFADVYEFHCPATKSKWAIKCFTRPVSGLRERYSQISKALQDAHLPFTVDFQYLEQGMRIRGSWYPILKMRWIEGLLLNEFVRDNLDKPALLGQLSLIWVRMARRLRAAGIAHCDLQHGNVLLVPGSKNASLAVKLIDYDGMFVPALARTKSGEVGHPNYQHPQRLREGTYDVEVDRFPLLVVATALQALAVGGRDLWKRHDNGDNLLFKESDLRLPGQSAVFKELQGVSDSQTKALVSALLEACQGRLEETPRIEELVPDTRPTAATASSGTVKAAATGAVAATNAWDFDEPASGRLPRRSSRRQGTPKWIWIVSSSAALLFVIAVLFAMRGLSKTGESDQRASSGAGKDLSRTLIKETQPDDRAPKIDVANSNWSQLNISNPIIQDGYLHLVPHNVFPTKEAFRGPIEIATEVRIESAAVRLFAYAGSSLIVPCGETVNPLKVSRPDGSNIKLESGSPASINMPSLKPRVWHQLRWVISAQGMEVNVDDRMVFREKRPYNLSASAPVRISSDESVMNIRSFQVKALDPKVLLEFPSRPGGSKGMSWDEELDCRASSRHINNVGNPGNPFDITKNWVLSLDVVIPDLSNQAGLIFFIGDERPGRDPLFVVQHSNKLEFVVCNASDNTGYGIPMPISPTMLGKWVSAIFRYNASASEVELYIDGTLVAKERCPITPRVDRQMPIWIGSDNQGGQRFFGKTRSLWLANN